MADYTNMQILANGDPRVFNILKDQVLEWGVGGMFLVNDFAVKCYPKWFRGHTILQLNELFEEIRFIRDPSSDIGFWLREFLRFLITTYQPHPQITVSSRPKTGTMRQFFESYQLEWELFEDRIKEIFDDQ